MNVLINTTQRITQSLSDFVNLLYPNICCGCNNHLTKTEQYICLQCIFDLPKTNYHNLADNPVSRIFWGRVQLQAATAFVFFQKEGLVQNFVHQLKYKGRKEIGVILGKHFGAQLLQSPLFSNVDVLVPVPLHPDRQRKRGYNQSECIAEGMAQTMQKPIDTTSFFRTVATQTQTKKSRTQRWDNVSDIFSLTDNHPLQGKHVLLIDDVVTTGATIDACATTLLNNGVAQVSLASLAVAVM